MTRSLNTDPAKQNPKSPTTRVDHKYCIMQTRNQHGINDKELFKNHEDYWQVADNIKNIYMSDGSLTTLLDFERVLDELDIYAFKNWEIGELVEGPDIGVAPDGAQCRHEERAANPDTPAMDRALALRQAADVVERRQPGQARDLLGGLDRIALHDQAHAGGDLQPRGRRRGGGRVRACACPPA